MAGGDGVYNLQYHPLQDIERDEQNYLNIIGQLRQELDYLSDEVCSYKQEMNATDFSDADLQIFEQIMCQFTQQNDRLQNALDEAANKNTLTITQLENNNKTLQNQVDKLQNELCEKEHEVAELTLQLNNAFISKEEQEYTQHECQEYCKEIERRSLAQARQLANELSETKCKNAELNAKLRELTGLLRTQETHRMQITYKYSELEETFEEQKRKLQLANNQLTSLQNRLDAIEKSHGDADNMRRNDKKEIFDLKETLATALGRNKSLEQLLKNSEIEINMLKEKLYEQEKLLNHNNEIHKAHVKKSKEVIEDLQSKLNLLWNDYKRKKEEYIKKESIYQQNEKIIESFRKWKEAQTTSDMANRTTIKQFRKHIDLLLEEKKSFMERYRELRKEYNLLKNEIERLHKITPKSAKLNIGSTSSVSFKQQLDLIRTVSSRLNEKIMQLHQPTEFNLSSDSTNN